MTIRAKLWLLLLAIGLVPMSLLALFFLHGTRELGGELTENASDALQGRELAYLEAKVAGNVALLGNHFDLLRQALEDQARGVEAALAAADGAGDVPFAMASDIDSGRAASVRDPLYERLDPAGAAAVSVVLDRVAIHLPPGSQRAERRSEMRRLATLAPTYARPTTSDRHARSGTTRASRTGCTAPGLGTVAIPRTTIPARARGTGKRWRPMAP